ncbi:MAG: metallophosphoesterase, partial [Lewinella sp.]|nr:metallophosphoesterase [Lewinella sp.]
MCRYPFFLLLLLFVSCEETSAPFSTYRPLDDRDSVRWASIRQWQGGPPPTWEPLLWRYQLGDTTETLHYDLRPLPAPDSLVRLPHRLVHPNRAMWYRTRVRFGHDQLLYVNADDGAQVFVAGAQVPQALPNSFRIPATEDSVDLHIRVLNNAMAGGLRQARFSPWEEGLTFYSRQDWAAQLLAGPPPWDTVVQVQPLLIAEPYWQRRADEQYRLRFVTAATGPATLHWGRSAGQLTETRQPALAEAGVLEFAWPASELPDTCFYQLRQGGSQSPVYHWSTAAERAGFTFTAWGDSQGGWPTFARLSRLMAADHPDFSIGLGDLVSDGALHTQWFDFLASLGPVAGQTVVYPVVGNHDYDGFYDDLIPALYQRYIREDTYFAWRYRNCYFVALDPNEQFPLGFSDKQQAWLRAQMA